MKIVAYHTYSFQFIVKEKTERKEDDVSRRGCLGYGENDVIRPNMLTNGRVRESIVREHSSLPCLIGDLTFAVVCVCVCVCV